MRNSQKKESVFNVGDTAVLDRGGDEFARLKVLSIDDGQVTFGVDALEGTSITDGDTGNRLNVEQ